MIGLALRKCPFPGEPVCCNGNSENIVGHDDAISTDTPCSRISVGQRLRPKLGLPFDIMSRLARLQYNS